MKKLQLIMLVTLAAVAAAFAQEIPVVKLGDVQLTDGRVYKDAVFVSESPLRITVRHANGLAQIDKKQLPAPLAAKYPADEAAAERQRIESEQRAAAVAAEYERTRPMREAQAKIVKMERQTSAAYNAATEANEKAAELTKQSAAEQKVQKSVETYFRTTWRPGNNAVRITDLVITLDDVQPKPGWAGQYTFEGEAYVEYWMSSGSSFTSNRMRFTGDMDAKGKCSIITR